jgi:membrane-bound lytic murein transglycosylase F
LLGGRLEVVAESSHAALLEQLRDQEPSLTWIEDSRAGAEDLIRKVAAGEIDYAIADSHVFALLRHFYPEVRVAFSLGPVNHVAWALPKGAEELHESIAAYFAEIEATGALQQILDRYYFASSEFDYVSSRAFARHVSARLPRYRDYFQEAQDQTGVDWRLLAAIAYQESHWNPAAVSPTGVRGMMMMTEHTADMMLVDDRSDPRTSILGGAQYFERGMHKIPDRIPEPDRTWFAIAAYNVGYGHVEDARILTETQKANPDSWTEVRERLPLLSDEQWHKRVKRGYAPGAQTVSYVDNVRRYYEILMWMTSSDALTNENSVDLLYTPPPSG